MCSFVCALKYRRDARGMDIFDTRQGQVHQGIYVSRNANGTATDPQTQQSQQPICTPMDRNSGSLQTTGTKLIYENDDNPQQHQGSPQPLYLGQVTSPATTIVTKQNYVDATVVVSDGYTGTGHTTTGPTVHKLHQTTRRNQPDYDTIDDSEETHGQAVYATTFRNAEGTTGLASTDGYSRLAQPGQSTSEYSTLVSSADTTIQGAEYSRLAPRDTTVPEYNSFGQASTSVTTSAISQKQEDQPLYVLMGLNPDSASMSGGGP